MHTSPISVDRLLSLILAIQQIQILKVATLAIGSLQTVGSIDVSGNYSYVADSTSGLDIIKIGAPDQPPVIDTANSVLSGTVNKIADAPASSTPDSAQGTIAFTTAT